MWWFCHPIFALFEDSHPVLLTLQKTHLSCQERKAQNKTQVAKHQTTRERETHTHTHTDRLREKRENPHPTHNTEAMAEEAAPKTEEVDIRRNFNYPLVVKTDMNEEMLAECTETAQTAIEKHSKSNEDAANMLKEIMDKKFGAPWYVDKTGFLQLVFALTKEQSTSSHRHKLYAHRHKHTQTHTHKRTHKHTNTHKHTHSQTHTHTQHSLTNTNANTNANTHKCKHKCKHCRNVIIGEAFGFEVTHQTSNLLYMFFGGNLAVLVWKCQ